jgi:hypothetical protein
MSKYTEEETLWEKIGDKLFDLTPAPIIRTWDWIDSKWRDLCTSFKNWMNGYGWFPDSHWYSFDYVASEWMYKRLKLYRDKVSKGHGHAIYDWVLSEERRQEHWTGSKPYTKEEEDKMEKKWIEILDDILFALKEAFDEEIRVVSVFGSTGIAEMEKINKRVDRGHRYLGKYFKNLWD